MHNRRSGSSDISPLAKGFRKYSVNYLGLLPFFALFVLFIIIPMAQGIYRSFTDWSVSSRQEINFVGLQNYITILSGEGNTSTRFLKSLLNLLVYAPIAIVVGLTISLVLSLVVRQFPKKLFDFFRGVYFVPTVLPLFLCVGIWEWYMTADTGLVASFLASLGVGEGVIWKQTPGYAVALVIIIDLWNAIGFNFVIISAGMQDISPDLYEVAEIDGASTFQKMTKITIPLIEPILFFTVVYSFISALQVYDIPWILTGYDDMNAVGGPNQVILFPVMEMVRNVYLGGDSGLGRACAEGVVLMSVIMVITLIQFKVRKKKV
jgi:multiple sugar transport system permease protein